MCVVDNLEAALSDAAEIIGRLLEHGRAGKWPEQSEDQWDAAYALAEDWLRVNGFRDTAAKG